MEMMELMSIGCMLWIASKIEFNPDQTTNFLSNSKVESND